MIGNITAGLFGTPTPVSTNSYESIATINATGSTNIVTFSSIPQTYSHLQIRGIAKCTTAGGQLTVTCNGVTNVFNDHGLQGDGATATAFYEATSSFFYGFANNTTTANMFGAGIVDILDYTNTNKFKTFRGLSGNDNNGSGYITLTSALYRSTNAITSLEIKINTGNIAQYSTFALYGIKD